MVKCSLSRLERKCSRLILIFADDILLIERLLVVGSELSCCHLALGSYHGSLSRADGSLKLHLIDNEKSLSGTNHLTLIYTHFGYESRHLRTYFHIFLSLNRRRIAFIEICST